MAALVSGDVSLENIQETLSRLVLYPTSKHTFHEASEGPLGVLDLPTHGFLGFYEFS